MQCGVLILFYHSILVQPEINISKFLKQNADGRDLMRLALMKETVLCTACMQLPPVSATAAPPSCSQQPPRGHSKGNKNGELKQSFMCDISDGFGSTILKSIMK